MFQTVTDKISILGISAVVAMTLRGGGGGGGGRGGILVFKRRINAKCRNLKVCFPPLNI